MGDEVSLDPFRQRIALGFRQVDADRENAGWRENGAPPLQTRLDAFIEARLSGKMGAIWALIDQRTDDLSFDPSLARPRQRLRQESVVLAFGRRGQREEQQVIIVVGAEPLRGGPFFLWMLRGRRYSFGEAA